jgi:UPF0271 protein
VPHVDLNSDVGEGFGAFPGGPDEALVPLLTSVNVACGSHAGDPSTMRRTCELAVAHDCVIGAQVSYPDLLGFGRRFIDMRPSELTDVVLFQIGALDAFAGVQGTRVRYVKPHGALYNAIVHHERQADAVARAVREYDPGLAMLGLPSSQAQIAAERAGLQFVREGFADRRYTAEGTLVPRTEAGALIIDPADAAAQALELAAGDVESICVHSDTPGADAILAAVRVALLDAGFAIEPFLP